MLTRKVTLFAHFVWNAAILAADLIIVGDFTVAKETVLELGAGAGLPGIVACLHGARIVVLSDYESPKLLVNLQANVDDNIPAALRRNVFVEGHIWGRAPGKIVRYVIWPRWTFEEPRLTIGILRPFLASSSPIASGCRNSTSL